MRARELVFHVGCFCCIYCGIHLSPGDTAAVRGGRVFCGEHYDADVLRYTIHIYTTYLCFYSCWPRTDTYKYTFLSSVMFASVFLFCFIQCDVAM